MNPLIASLRGFIIRVKYLKTTKKTLGVIVKEVIGKISNIESSLPKKLLIEKKKQKHKDIAEEFNNFFTNVGQNLAKKFPNSSNSFASFLNQTHSIMEKSLAINKRVKGGFLLIKN